ncbi:MAG TPA: phosphate ABC transporter permease subunit PstC, partial [Acidimicrobiia bacterium]|nr:phosphate ABC transporter permease subunit PstC [Acidimicrobiia bacterium]
MTVEAPSEISRSLRGDPRRQRREAFWHVFFLGAAAVSIVITIAIIFSLVGEAWTFISNVDLSSLWDIGWFPRRGLFDIRTIVVGTLLVAGIAMLVATPLGIGAAMYLSEYARPRVRRVLKPALEILAGIPSVVLGYFALT